MKTDLNFTPKQKCTEEKYDVEIFKILFNFNFYTTMQGEGF